MRRCRRCGRTYEARMGTRYCAACDRARAAERQRKYAAKLARARRLSARAMAGDVPADVIAAVESGDRSRFREVLKSREAKR